MMLLPLNVSDAVALVEFDESKVAADVEDEAAVDPDTAAESETVLGLTSEDPAEEAVRVEVGEKVTVGVEELVAVATEESVVVATEESVVVAR